MKLREKEYERLTSEANEMLAAGESAVDTYLWLNKQVDSLTLSCISRQRQLSPDKEEWKDRLEGAEAARDDFAANNL